MIVGKQHRSIAAHCAAIAALAVLAGCVIQEQKPIQRLYAQKATAEVANDELLDVGVRLFDPNIPEDVLEQEKKRVYPDVRKAESRYFPILIRDTLEDTGYWGQARVLPADGTGMDVYVDGKIVESTGRELKLDVKVSDATGRVWFTKTYEGEADLRAYKDTAIAKPRDPYDNVYNQLANDLLAARRELTAAQRTQIREVSHLRFASDLAPYAYDGYLTQDRKGVYKVVRLPAPGDPMTERLDKVRERDYTLVDTLNEYYTTFGSTMSESYTNWRKYSHEELEAETLAKREALTRQILGAAAVIGGIIAESQTNSSAGSVASTAAVVGGIYAVKSGFDKRAEIKLHSESLKQLGESFQAEVQPMVVDVEGRTLELKGSAEQQYAEWRHLLKELYENETGLPAATSSTAAGVDEPGASRP